MTLTQQQASDQRMKRELIDLLEDVSGVDAWNALRWIVDHDMDLVREALREAGFDA